MSLTDFTIVLHMGTVKWEHYLVDLIGSHFHRHSVQFTQNITAVHPFLLDIEVTPRCFCFVTGKGLGNVDTSPLHSNICIGKSLCFPYEMEKLRNSEIKVFFCESPNSLMPEVEIPHCPEAKLSDTTFHSVVQQ